MAVELNSMLHEAFRFYSLTTDGLSGRTRILQGAGSLKNPIVNGDFTQSEGRFRYLPDSEIKTNIAFRAKIFA